MEVTGGLPGIALILAVASACVGSGGPGPIQLYPGPPKDPLEFSIIQVAKTHPTRGHPTLNIRKITQMSDSAVVLFQVQAGQGWAVPSHLGGLPDPGQGGGISDWDLPSVFHLPPAAYQVTFLYVPAVDRIGWTHQNRTPETVIVECKPGHTYVMEGKLQPDGEMWTLRLDEEVTRSPENKGDSGH
jgi:hypothetical protein